MIAGILEGLGYSVVCAHDAYSAMANYVRAKPSLAILDYQMPAGSGVDVLNKIRATDSGRKLPVVFLSAVSLFEVQSNVTDHTNVRFMEKPLDTAALKKNVSEMLRAAGLKPPASSPAPQAAPARPPKRFDGEDNSDATIGGDPAIDLDLG